MRAGSRREVQRKNVGTIGDLGTWSFCQDKIIATGGEGGMVTCNDKTLMKALWSFKDHGKDFDLTRNLTNGNQFKWLHTAFGTNLRMTEMQAAIGRVQLKSCRNGLSTNSNAQAIIEILSEFGRKTLSFDNRNSDVHLVLVAGQQRAQFQEKPNGSAKTRIVCARIL